MVLEPGGKVHQPAVREGRGERMELWEEQVRKRTGRVSMAAADSIDQFTKKDSQMYQPSHAHHLCLYVGKCHVI